MYVQDVSPVTCWSTSSVSTSSISTADISAGDAEELVVVVGSDGSPSSPAEEFVNIVSIAYTADDDDDDGDEEEFEFVGTSLAISSSAADDEFVAEPL